MHITGNRVKDLKLGSEAGVVNRKFLETEKDSGIVFNAGE
jgi:hypothetical protein